MIVVNPQQDIHSSSNSLVDLEFFDMSWSIFLDSFSGSSEVDLRKNRSNIIHSDALHHCTRTINQWKCHHDLTVDSDLSVTNTTHIQWTIILDHRWSKIMFRNSLPEDTARATSIIQSEQRSIFASGVAKDELRDTRRQRDQLGLDLLCLQLSLEF